jgi:hypothetical protein
MVTWWRTRGRWWVTGPSTRVSATRRASRSCSRRVDTQEQRTLLDSVRVRHRLIRLIYLCYLVAVPLADLDVAKVPR